MKYKLKEFETKISVTRLANIHYFEFTRQYHTFNDSHAFRELVYVDNGSINIKAENFSGKLEKNRMIIHQADENHFLTCDGDVAPNVIIIGFECKSHDLDIFSKMSVELNAEQQKLLTEIIKEGRSVFLPPYNIPNQREMKMREDYPYGADQMIRLKLETLLIELVRSMSLTKESADGMLSDSKTFDVYKYINENYKENINLNELCFIYNTNKTTLCSSFKQAYGVTIINYINSLKIREGKRLMREGKMNLTEISESLGFSSIHYFSRLFKRFENKTPSDYVKTIKARSEEQEEENLK